jgi:hypothetical protein
MSTKPKTIADLEKYWVNVVEARTALDEVKNLIDARISELDKEDEQIDKEMETCEDCQFFYKYGDCLGGELCEHLIKSYKINGARDELIRLLGDKEE